MGAQLPVDRVLATIGHEPVDVLVAVSRTRSAMP